MQLPSSFSEAEAFKMFQRFDNDQDGFIHLNASQIEFFGTLQPSGDADTDSDDDSTSSGSQLLEEEDSKTFDDDDEGDAQTQSQTKSTVDRTHVSLDEDEADLLRNIRGEFATPVKTENATDHEREVRRNATLV